MLTVLRDQMATRYPDHTRIGDSILRVVRKLGDSPIAAYFFDFSEHLPITNAELDDYQDRYIGPDYFAADKSLQWNSYLYFVIRKQLLSGKDVPQLRNTIENDRRYARKFVITPEELESVLTPTAVTETGRHPSGDILTLWTDRLEAAGIYDAVATDTPLASRVKVIADSSTPSQGTKPSLPPRVSSPAPVIRSLVLEDYRRFPLQRSFDFGRVNLFVGPNGTGKTSLLEAIELFYCGKNKRNPTHSKLPEYNISAHLTNGRIERATHKRDLQLFRDRNLEWYGVAEQKTTNLFLSFARYNFLDTDAAVSLAETTSSIDEDLSKLLVGPNASVLWKQIVRVGEAVDAELRSVVKSEQHLSGELRHLKAQLMEQALIRPESDSLRNHLTDILRRLEWPHTTNEQSRVPSSLLSELAEFASLAQQATRLTWVGSPVTRDRIAQCLADLDQLMRWLEPHIAQVEDCQGVESGLSLELANVEAAAKLAEQVRDLCEAGVPDRTVEFKKLQAARHTLAGLLAALDEDALGHIPDMYQSLTLATGALRSQEMLARADASRSAAKAELERFNHLKDESTSLTQQLRSIANRLLKTSPTPDRCPLCHTDFAPGALGHHMYIGVEAQLEALGQELLGRLEVAEDEVRRASVSGRTIAELTRFCIQRSLPAGTTTIRSALIDVKRSQAELSHVNQRLEDLQAEITLLKLQGMSSSTLEDHLNNLRKLGYPIANPSVATSNDLLVSLGARAATLSDRLGEVRASLERLDQSRRDKLPLPVSGVRGLNDLLSQSKEQLVITSALRKSLDRFQNTFPWPADKPFAELALAAESVRKIAADLQAAINKEQQRAESSNKWKTRKEHLEAELSVLRPRQERLASAHRVLTDLQEQHALPHAMKEALHQNRKVIEAIFSRIHAPAEFERLGSDLGTLVRKDGTKAGLTEISTGQRAAFALSIFLAQNAHLTPSAPPVLLIDDPIAHVDDLNCLSFLDYLRELVLTGKRQVFFATANTRLAGLFERKFDFLGKGEFRRFDFSRESLHSASIT